MGGGVWLGDRVGLGGGVWLGNRAWLVGRCRVGWRVSTQVGLLPEPHFEVLGQRSVVTLLRHDCLWRTLAEFSSLLIRCYFSIFSLKIFNFVSLQNYFSLNNRFFQ